MSTASAASAPSEASGVDLCEARHTISARSLTHTTSHAPAIGKRASEASPIGSSTGEACERSERLLTLPHPHSLARAATSPRVISASTHSADWRWHSHLQGRAGYQPPHQEHDSPRAWERGVRRARCERAFALASARCQVVRSFRWFPMFSTCSVTAPTRVHRRARALAPGLSPPRSLPGRFARGNPLILCHQGRGAGRLSPKLSRTYTSG